MVKIGQLEENGSPESISIIKLGLNLIKFTHFSNSQFRVPEKCMSGLPYLRNLTKFYFHFPPKWQQKQWYEMPRQWPFWYILFYFLNFYPKCASPVHLQSEIFIVSIMLLKQTGFHCQGLNSDELTNLMTNQFFREVGWQYALTAHLLN